MRYWISFVEGFRTFTLSPLGQWCAFVCLLLVAVEVEVIVIRWAVK